MPSDLNNRMEESRPFWPSAWKPLAVAAAVHIVIIFGYSAFFHFNMSCFLNVGSSFQWADAEHFAPGTVKYTELPGYDACDYYVVALDPLMLRKDIAPTYKSPARQHGVEKFMRYQRFLYPLLINLLTCDTPRYFPLAMLFINFASTIGITIVLMKLLMRRGASPWLSLIFVLSGGMLLAFWLDMQMHLCFLLVVSALYYYETERVPVAALLFSIALVTWEAAVLLAGPIGLWELLHRRWRNVAFFLLTPLPVLTAKAYFSYKLDINMFARSFLVLTLPFMGIAREVVILFKNASKEGTIQFLRNLLVLPAMGIFLAMLPLAGWKLWQAVWSQRSEVRDQKSEIRSKGAEGGALRVASGQDGLYELIWFLQVVFFAMQSEIVLDTFVAVIRLNAGVFLPFILSYRDRKDKVSPWIFAWAVLLAVLAFVRIFSGVHEPYVLIGGG